MRIAHSDLEVVLAHAERALPNECCGVLGVRDGCVVSVHPLENLAASPMRFEVDGLALMRVIDELEDAGAELGSIYHSHPRSEAYPSQTDVNFAANWPGVEWLIIGQLETEREVRSFLIDASGEVVEVTVNAT